MKPPAPSLDRRIPEPLLAELRAGGAFDWVSELARAQLTRERPLDLGLRKDARKKVAHATLYLGTTKVLDVRRDNDGRFALKGEQTGGLFKPIKAPFQPAWTAWQSLAGLEAQMPAIRARVEAAIAAAPASHLNEGFLQAAISRASGIAPVDREVMLAWGERTKAAGMARLRAPLEHAQKQLAYTGRPPGDKVDALAIDADGRVLVIEVKPGTATSTLVWTPVQVGMYMQLVEAWLVDLPTLAPQVLTGMARQRVELGLAPGPVPELKTPLEAVPVIALGTPVLKPEHAEQRFAEIRDAVRAAGVPLAGLELWTIDEAGTVTRTGKDTL